MGRDIPFSDDKKCDLCGGMGAFDFMGDYICQTCVEKARDETAAEREQE